MPCHDNSSYDTGPSTEQLLRRAEKQLCEARWLLLRLVSHCGAMAPHDLIELIGAHRREHLKHRRNDRDDQIRRVERVMEQLAYNCRRIRELGGEPSPTLTAKLAALQFAVPRLQAVTDAELVAEYWGNDTHLPVEGL